MYTKYKSVLQNVCWPRIEVTYDSILLFLNENQFLNEKIGEGSYSQLSSLVIINKPNMSPSNLSSSKLSDILSYRKPASDNLEKNCVDVSSIVTPIRHTVL
mmetsp:Transcript_17694/g.35293  ORF Transcript_17694/g.35293 Transcript_17694/m.35293 type:complete len:101 (+) Transcript_17694:305-607(+)